MKKMFFAVTLFAVGFCTGASAQSGTTQTTRYWDGCKAHCMWSANTRPNPPCVDCDRDGNMHADRDSPTACGTSGTGTGFTCMFHAPFVGRDGRSYGFAAGGPGDCGKCYELSFSGALSGKKMVVMVSNTGGEVIQGGHLDIMIPGGGVGYFDALNWQLGLKNRPDRASNYCPVNDMDGVPLGNPKTESPRCGGFRAACGNNAACVRAKCEDAFGRDPKFDALLQGCLWYIDWFNMADNPNANYETVTCPAELADRYSGKVTHYGGTAVTYTVTFNANGGSVTPATAVTDTNGVLTMSSLPEPTRSGSTFTGWYTTASTGGEQVTASRVYTSNTTVFARWTTTGGGARDTIKVEAESLTRQLPTCNANATSNPMCRETANNITNIGWIGAGDSAAYSVNITNAGAYSMRFRVATAAATSFTVAVNGVDAGTVNVAATGSSSTGWTTYATVPLDADVALKQGANTIALKFGGAVNIDYFLLIGDAATSARFGAASAGKAAARTRVTLRPVSGGFIAGLPANHTFTSYKLIDLQGREIRRGNIEAGATDLKIGSLKSGVVFLRLEGAGVQPAVLRATAAR